MPAIKDKFFIEIQVHLDLEGNIFGSFIFHICSNSDDVMPAIKDKFFIEMQVHFDIT